MNAVTTLALKDLKLLLRDKAGFFFAFGFPIIYAIFFGSIFSGAAGDYKGRKVPLLVVDEDQSKRSREFVKRLNDSGDLAIEQTNRSDAFERVRHGKKPAFIVLPQGFGEARRGMFAGKTATIQMGADPARGGESAMITGMLTQEMYAGFQEAFSDPAEMSRQLDDALEQIEESPDVDPVTRALLRTFFGSIKTFTANMSRLESSQPAASSATSRAGEGFSGFNPVKIEKIELEVARRGPRNFYAVSFPQGIIWGVMGCAAGFGISLVTERTKGTLRRLRTAPISQAQILGGKALACLLTTIGVSVALLLIARSWPFFVVPYSLPLLALAVVCVAICFVGIMMLLAVIGRSEQSASGIGWAVLTLMAMIGGGMVPQFIMPQWMQQLGSISPIKWAILAIEGALWREFSFAEMLPPCGILLAVGVACFATGVGFFGRLQSR